MSNTPLKETQNIVIEWINKAPKLKTSLTADHIYPPPQMTSKQVKAVREYLGTFQESGKLSQVKFALIMDVTEITIQGWESGRQIPDSKARRLMQHYVLCPDLVILTTKKERTIKPPKP